MYFLKNIIKVFYFTIGIFLILNLIFSSIYGFKITPVFFVFYFIFTIPLLEKIFNYLLKDEIKNIDFSYKGLNFLKYLGFLLLIIIMINMSLSFLNFVFISIVYFIFAFGINSRFLYFFALSMLVFVVGFIVVDNKVLAEKLSIYSYYFLIVGVIASIFENFKYNNELQDEIK